MGHLWESEERRLTSEALMPVFWAFHSVTLSQISDSSFPSVTRAIIEEVVARGELDEDVEIPLPDHLDSKTRSKLGIL